jgi:hypothetical protein
LLTWWDHHNYLSAEGYFAVSQVMALGQLGNAVWWVAPLFWSYAFAFAAIHTRQIGRERR